MEQLEISQSHSRRTVGELRKRSVRDALSLEHHEEEALAQFKSDVNAPFDLKRLSKERRPIDMGAWQFERFPIWRVNNYLLRSNDGTVFDYGDISEPEIREFVDYVMIKMSALGLSCEDRYCYITIDQGWIEPGKTLRQSGWHIDGMQGNEVPTKKPTDFQFIWSDCLPTRFAPQGFDTEGLDPSIHNVFSRLDRQVDPDKIMQPEASHIQLMNGYHVHEAATTTKRVYRRFIRVSFTHLPITSTSMTMNPAAAYNYPCHTTSGQIPCGLT